MSLLKFADIEEEYAKEKQLRHEDVSKLAEWQLMQPHLPSPFHPILTTVFLHNCSYSNEAVKQRIDAFYTFRTHCPHLFAYTDPLGAELQLGLKTILFTNLPKLTPEGHMVLYLQLLDNNPNFFNMTTMCKMIDLITLQSILQRGCQKGIVAVVNLEGIEMAHVLKISINTIKNMLVYLQIAAPLHIDAFHFVNSVPFTDKILALMRPFLGKHFKDKLIVHFGNNATIFKYVPEDILPIECGGASFCAKDYFTNVTRKEFEGSGEFFKMFASLLVDEAKRPDKQTCDLNSVDGTFKKLNVD